MFASLDVPALTQKVRLLSDTRGSTYVTDQEIADLLSDSFDILHNSLIESDQGYFMRETDNLSPTNGNELVFPPDLYKIRSVLKVSGAFYYPIYQKSLSEVVHIDSPIISAFTGPVVSGYVLFPDRIKLYPKDSVSGLQFRLVYSTDPLPLAGGSMQRSWEKYLSYKTAYTISVLQQNPNTQLADLALEWREAIKQSASNRNTGTRVVKDLETAHYGGFFTGY